MRSGRFIDRQWYLIIQHMAKDSKAKEKNVVFGNGT